MSKLKIYMCSGVGAARDEYRYWLDGTSTASNTRAVNSLLARINELCVELDYLSLTKEDQIEHYNRLDLLVISLQFAKQYAGDDSALARAGRILQQYINDGKFDYQDTEDSTRGVYLDNLWDAVSSAVSSGQDSTATGDYLTWWLESVVPNNRQGLSPTQIAAAKTFFFKPDGVGDSLDQYKRQYGDIGEYIYNSADYFLYLYIPSSDIKRLPYFLRKKIAKQREMYDYVCKVFTGIYGSEDDLQRVIRTRIMADTGHTPEEAITPLLKSRGIGDFGISEIIALITLIASVVIPIITALIQFAQNVLVAKYAIPENIEEGCPEPTDWPEEKKQNLLKFGIVAAVLYYILK